MLLAQAIELYERFCNTGKAGISRPPAQERPEIMPPVEIDVVQTTSTFEAERTPCTPQLHVYVGMTAKPDQQTLFRLSNVTGPEILSVPDLVQRPTKSYSDTLPFIALQTGPH